MNKDFWKTKNVLVTGADGFLATHLIREIIEAGATVTGVIRTKKAYSVLDDTGLSDRINIVYGNIIDARCMLDTVDKFNIDTIFHLAASSQVSAAANSPVNTFHSNILGTLNILEAARLRVPQVKRIICSSSDKAYGDHRVTLPYREDYALKGIYPYDCSKSCADLIAQTYFVSYKLPIRITRCTNIYGPGDLNFLRLVPGTIIRTLLGKPTILLSHIAPVMREFLFIKDAVSAYITIMENITCDGIDYKLEHTPAEGYRAYSHNAYNIGGGLASRKTVQQAAEAVLDKMGASNYLEINESPGRAGELSSQYADSSKMMLEYGWQPKINFGDGISRTISWYELNFDKFKASAKAHFKD